MREYTWNHVTVLCAPSVGSYHFLGKDTIHINNEISKRKPISYEVSQEQDRPLWRNKRPYMSIFTALIHCITESIMFHQCLNTAWFAIERMQIRTVSCNTVYRYKPLDTLVRHLIQYVSTFILFSYIISCVCVAICIDGEWKLWGQLDKFSK